MTDNYRVMLDVSDDDYRIEVFEEGDYVTFQIREGDSNASFMLGEIDAEELLGELRQWYSRRRCW